MEKEGEVKLTATTTDQVVEPKVESPVQPVVTMIESRQTSAVIKRGNDSYPITFSIMPEVPSLSAASALAEVRKVLKLMLKPDAVASIADEVVSAMDSSAKTSMKGVLKKLLPMLQGGVLQRKLYGDTLSVTGSTYVQETLAKELNGVAVHVAVLFEAIKADPIVLARIIPHVMGGDTPGESPSADGGKWM